MSNYPHSGNEYSDKQDYVDVYKAKDINDAQDELAYIEGVLSGGEEGQIMTADAEGKAGWEDAGGGGLLWDTLDYSVGARTGGGEVPYQRQVTVTLKNGEVAISEDTVLTFTFMNNEGVFLGWSKSNVIGIGGTYPVGEQSEPAYAIGLYYYVHTNAPVALDVFGPEMVLYLIIFKPTGGIERITIDLTSSPTD